MKSIDKYKNMTKGFTLVELLITVAIISIIIASAWPVYDSYQIKNRRTDGISTLLQNSSILEKCYINNSAYTGCALALPVTSPRNYYNIANALTAETYTLTANPVGVQAGDVECTSLSINHLGVKSSTGTAPMKRCWSQ